MANSKAADRYAKSLYQLAKENGTVEAVLADIQYYQSVVSDNRELQSVISSPIIPGTKKQAILDAIFTSRFQKTTSLFFKLVVSKGREKELTEIASAFIHEDKRQKGIKEGKLVSASPLTDALRTSLIAQAEKMAGGKVSITEKVDPSLIGGYVLTVNDVQFDESVQTKLTKLREQLLDTSYIPKIDLI